MENKTRRIWLCVLFSAAALFFWVAPAYSEFVRGGSRQFMSHHLWKDGMELAIYFAVMLALGMWAKGKRGFVVIAVSALYLMSTGALLQCLISYVYIELLLYIGRFFLAFLFPKEKERSAGICFLGASAIWGILAILMSLLRMGTIRELRILTVVLVLLALVNPKMKKKADDILAVRYVKYLNKNGRTEFLTNLFFILIMLISFARVNTHLEFDSFWYALYPEKCLFGENSFYDFLGYTDFVYYYPKFKELLMAPISGLGLPGYLISANLWIMIIGASEVYGFLCRNIRGSNIQVLCVTYLIFSTVCIVGISGTAKSDAVSYLYFLLMVLYFVECFRTREQFPFWVALAAGMMSYTVKYTNFLFSTIVFALVVCRVLYLLARKEFKPQKPALGGMILVLAACIIFSGILYRTCELTGYPTYREAKVVWDTLGFQGKSYFDAEVSDKPADVFEPERIYEALFDVGKIDKISIAWIGNYSVFFWLCLLVIYGRRQQNDHGLLLAIAVALAASSLYFLITMASPDGNYFSVAIVVVTCYILVRMNTSAYWNDYRRWFTTVAVGFMLLNLAFVFITHPSRQPGIRTWERPVSLIMTEAEKWEIYELELKNLGAYEIQERLKQTDGNDFIMADGGDPRMSMLNARVEIAGGFFQRYLSGTGVETYQDFVGYVEYVEVDGFIVLKEGGVEPFGEYVRQYIEENGLCEVLETEKYRYYRIR